MTRFMLITSLAMAPFAAITAQDPKAADLNAGRFNVTVRYRIVAGRNERIAEYRAMNRFLKSIGFTVDPNQDDDPRDPNETLLRGTVDSRAKLPLFFAERHVQALLITPNAYKLPDDPAALVKVQLQIRDGLPLVRQRVFADQVRSKLVDLGFNEAVGYDNRGHTRILGLFPAADVMTLLNDLRWQPSGWLASEKRADDLPTPLRGVSPIRIVEILPLTTEALTPKGWGPVRTSFPEDLKQKLSPELRSRSAEDPSGRGRYELFLRFAPEPADDLWRSQLQQVAPNLVIEGRLGTMVTIVASPADLSRLVQIPNVSGIRLPRPANVSLRSSASGGADNAKALQQAGIDKLHTGGFRGQGVRAAIVDGDFRGWEKSKGNGLPNHVRYLDLTAERNVQMLPDSTGDSAAETGSGTQAALAFALAAPDAELTLIRVDPGALHQLDGIVRLIRGELVASECLTQRNAELRADAEELRRRRTLINEERTRILNDFGQDAESIKRRDAHFQAKAQLERDEKNWQERQVRYVNLIEARSRLAGIQVISSSMVWESGYPLSGDSQLSRLFTDEPPCEYFWFQAAGDTRGQAWAGLFRDVDGNRAMEFAPNPASDTLPLWKQELAFLGWKPNDGNPNRELPEKSPIRISVQWREPRDPAVSTLPDDYYRKPLTDLRVVLLRQIDSSGRNAGVDEFEVVARSEGLPQRIDNQTNSSTFEHVIEFTPEAAQSYAVRLEGVVTDRIRPSGVATLPIQREGWELWPRFFVEAVDPQARLTGKPVLLDFATDLGGLGIVADAQGTITVGAADESGTPQSGSTVGPPLGRRLLPKPNVYACANLSVSSQGPASVFGTGFAAPFAAGATAAALSSGIPIAKWDVHLGQTGGKLLTTPGH